MPETTRPPAPPSVRNAVTAMYAGAAASIVGIAIDIVTVGATRTAIEHKSAKLTASQVSSLQHVLVAGFIVGGAIAAVLWIVLARACLGGRNWARITGTVLFAIATIDTLVGLTRAAPEAPAVKIWAIVVWLAGLAAVILLWRRGSTGYFTAVPR